MFMDTHCHRCRKETQITTMSMFNEDVLCMDCKEKEKQHPDYKRACAVEAQAVKNGNYNFKGIGKPADL